MNCNEFQQRLEQAIESHGPTANEVAAFARHLEHCDASECAKRWADHERLASATTQWRDELPIVDLVNRVVSELRDPSSGSREQDLTKPLRATYGSVREPAASTGRHSTATRPLGQSWMTLATVAAALMLMLSLLTLTRPSSTHEVAIDTPLPAAQAIGVGQEAVASTAEAPRPMFGRSYASMPLSATEFMTDAVVLVVPADLSEPDDEPSRANVWADRLGQQLEPIGRELSSAFELLAKAVPKSTSS